MKSNRWVVGFWCAVCLLTPDVWACQVAATGVFFGRYDGLTAQPTTGLGAIQLVCPQPALVRLTAGLHSHGDFTNRTLAAVNGSGHLRYNLFVDPTAIRIWGDGAANTYVQEVPSGNSTLHIYAVVPGGQRVPAGSYSDVVMVIVDW